MEKFTPYAVVLAGGKGSRLPIAGSIPKQFAPKFYDEETKNNVTFIQDIVRMITVDAIKPSKIIVVVTSEEQRQYAIEQLTPYKVPSTNVVIFDPHYGYVAVMAAAADYIRKHDKNAVVFITPSDSHIEGQALLSESIKAACIEAKNGTPVLIGAKVADANIVGGCGNARYDSMASGPLYDILDFIEKPGKGEGGEERVKQILMDDNTVVNTGLYAVRVDQFCEAYPKKKIDELLKRYYDEGWARVDLGLDPTEMVKKLNMKLMVGKFNWKDCGTLDAYYKIQVKTPNHKNAHIGENDRYECRDSMFVSTTKGVSIYASNIRKNVAVLAHMNPEGYLHVAVCNMKMSQEVSKITEFFETCDTVIPYSLNSRNCFVVPSNYSAYTRAAFLGVQNIYVHSNRLKTGEIILSVSANGECICDITVEKAA